MWGFSIYTQNGQIERFDIPLTRVYNSFYSFGHGAHGILNTKQSCAPQGLILVESSMKEEKEKEEKPELTEEEKRRLINLAKQRRLKLRKIKTTVKDG